MTKHKGAKSILQGTSHTWPHGFLKTNASTGDNKNTRDEPNVEFFPFVGADTPFYLATLPEDATEPNGLFYSDRKVIDFNSKIRY